MLCTETLLQMHDNMVLWLHLSLTWIMPCTLVPRLPIDHATTVVFHNRQINISCRSSLITPSQHLDQVLPLSVANSLLHRIAETICSVWTKQNWGKTDPRAALLLWDTNTAHHEFLSKMLRNRVNMLMKQEKICLCHSYTVPQCLKYAKRYFCLSLNKCVCWCVCVWGLISTCISLTIIPL